MKKQNFSQPLINLVGRKTAKRLEKALGNLSAAGGMANLRKLTFMIIGLFIFFYALQALLSFMSVNRGNGLNLNVGLLLAPFLAFLPVVWSNRFRRELRYMELYRCLKDQPAEPERPALNAILAVMLDESEREVAHRLVKDGYPADTMTLLQTAKALN